MTFLVKTLDGSFLPPARVKRSMVANFFDGSVPSWLEVPDGTFSFISSSKTARITTAATTNSLASIRLSSDLDIASIDAVFWTVEALTITSDSDVTVGINIQGTNIGASLFHRFNEALPVSRVNDDSLTEEDVNYRLRGNGEGTSKRNITFAMFPQSKHIYLLEDDQVMYHRKVDAMNLGVTRPEINISTGSDTARSIQFYQIKLDLYQN